MADREPPLAPFRRALAGIPMSHADSRPFARANADATHPGTITIVTTGDLRRLVTAGEPSAREQALVDAGKAFELIQSAAGPDCSQRMRKYAVDGAAALARLMQPDTVAVPLAVLMQARGALLNAKARLPVGPAVLNIQRALDELAPFLPPLPARRAPDPELQEIADGAFGDGPLTRGLARDRMAADAAAGLLVENTDPAPHAAKPPTLTGRAITVHPGGERDMAPPHLVRHPPDEERYAAQADHGVGPDVVHVRGPRR
jgi:hypothetical protein